MSADNRQMPNSDVIERMVIACMVLDADSRQTCRDGLTSDDFGSQYRSELFTLIVGLPRIDPTLVREALHGVPDRQRGIQLREELDTCMRQREWLKDAFSMEDYCAELRDRRVCRELITFGGYLAVDGTKGVPNGAEFIDEAEKRFGQIVASRQDASRAPLYLGEALSDLCDKIEAPDGAQEPVYLAQTGLPDLDESVGGFQRGAFWVIAGRPGAGKSAFAMQMAREIAVDHEVLVFSYEMSPEELAIRQVASMTGIDSRVIERRVLSRKQQMEVRNASMTLSNMKLKFMQPRGNSFEELRSMARAEHRKNGGKLGGILVDYIQRMSSKGKWQTKDQEYGHISHELKATAMELGCCVIAAAAINRESEKRANHRPVMSDMRECGAIEYDANVMVGIYRPDADPTAECKDEDRGTAEAILMKQRSGATGIVRLRFNAQTTSFLSQLHHRPNLRSV